MTIESKKYATHKLGKILALCLLRNSGQLSSGWDYSALSIRLCVFKRHCALQYPIVLLVL